MNINLLVQDSSFIAFCLASDKESVVKWETFIKEHPDLEPYIREAQSEVLILTGVLPKVLRRTKQAEFQQWFEDARLRRSRIRQIRRYLTLGAAACLLALCAIFYRNNQFESELTNHSFSSIKGLEYRSDGKPKTGYILSDGTRVVVYRGSQIRLSKDYNQNYRRVAVKGQVFFDVAQDKEKPFVVYSKNITTRALGTSFFVRDFEKGLHSSVLLLEGKLQVHKTDLSDSTVIDAGNAVLLSAASSKLVKSSISINALNQIAFGELVFKNSPSEEIFDKLEVFYGVEIDRSQCRCRLKNISGDYSRASLGAALNALAFINKVTWEMEGSKIILKQANHY